MRDQRPRFGQRADRCYNCGHVQAAWHGYCPGCGWWNTGLPFASPVADLTGEPLYDWAKALKEANHA